MRRAVVAVCLVGLTAVFATVAVAALERQSRDLDEPIQSVALGGTEHALVLLPAGYATSGERYPVVYFLHGLPAGPTTYRGNAWLATALERAGPAILVLPQGARDNDSDPEYLNWGTGRDWETFISGEVPDVIDKRFRTIRSRAGRALIGLSAGGYGATILGLGHLGRFSVIESWSGYFHATDPTGTVALATGPATSAHNLVPVLKADERRRPTFFGFYVGDGDKRFLAENRQFDHELTAAHVKHLFAVYSGGHTTALWQAHARVWLGLALSHLAKPA
ncbi:MAG TPA: alpha/beta hydrolase-fold protein [Gaiellaceae bacterium]|nr:alpha/beta hydrolase-fold protein [Gaiellaceae bacterium]